MILTYIVILKLKPRSMMVSYKGVVVYHWHIPEIENVSPKVHGLEFSRGSEQLDEGEIIFNIHSH